MLRALRRAPAVAPAAARPRRRRRSGRPTATRDAAGGRPRAAGDRRWAVRRRHAVARPPHRGAGATAWRGGGGRPARDNCRQRKALDPGGRRARVPGATGTLHATRIDRHHAASPRPAPDHGHRPPVRPRVPPPYAARRAPGGGPTRGRSRVRGGGGRARAARDADPAPRRTGGRRRRRRARRRRGGAGDRPGARPTLLPAGRRGRRGRPAHEGRRLPPPSPAAPRARRSARSPSSSSTTWARRAG
jgi:hypothetical protein